MHESPKEEGKGYDYLNGDALQSARIDTHSSPKDQNEEAEKDSGVPLTSDSEV